MNEQPLSSGWGTSKGERFNQAGLRIDFDCPGRFLLGHQGLRLGSRARKYRQVPGMPGGLLHGEAGGTQETPLSPAQASRQDQRKHVMAITTGPKGIPASPEVNDSATGHQNLTRAYIPSTGMFWVQRHSTLRPQASLRLSLTVTLTQGTRQQREEAAATTAIHGKHSKQIRCCVF